jgi:hypothetical protein
MDAPPGAGEDGRSTPPILVPDDRRHKPPAGPRQNSWSKGFADRFVGYYAYVTLTLDRLNTLDLDLARELVDGYAPADAPYRDLGEPSWFATDRDRRRYWIENAAAIVAWARGHGFASPKAALRYGLPDDARTALWNWSE